MIPLWKKNLDKSTIIKLLSSAIEKKYISEGPIVSKVEKKISKILKVKYCTMLPSGTAALLVAMIALGLKKNDLILIPERSWISVLNASILLGLKVKSIDVKKNSPVIDENEIFKLKQIPKAIVIAYMGGRAANIKKIIKYAKNKKIKIIEDSAQAFGSNYLKKNLGTFSNVGCFSLSMAKTITSGQGGFVVTNNKQIWSSIKKIKNNGLKNIYKIKKYGNFGFNFKFTDIASSIILSELENYKKNMINLYKNYKNNIIFSDKFKILDSNIEQGEIPQYIEAICTKREKFINYMKKNKIQCRAFYPSMSNSKFAFKIRNKKLNDEYFSNNGVFLPSGPHQDAKNVDLVINKINDFIFKHLN